MESINLTAVATVLGLVGLGIGLAVFAIRKAPFRHGASPQDPSRRGLDLAEALSACEAARAEAELASRAKSDFIALMSHELRTPLNSILGFAEAIKDQMFGAVGSERYVSYAGDIYSSGQHLLDIVNDILDLSKIEAVRLDLNEETVNLPALVKEVIDLVQEQAAARGISLKTDLPKGLPPLRADGRKIKQILINLLSNAIDFTPREGWIVLTAEESPKGGVTLAVADTGVGIAPEDLPRVLKPFQATGGPFGRVPRGTGLGLPLVKSLIELHGGQFHIESTPGAGTTVVLSFPAERVIEGGKEISGEQS